MIPAALPALLLLAATAALGWFVRPRPAPATRALRYRNWTARAGAAFLATSVAALALLGRGEAWWSPPPEFAGLRAMLPAMRPADVLIGGLAGVLIGGAVAGWRARRGGRPIGRIGALMPRRPGELPWGAVVAVTAGMAEEPFFRLLLPLLITLVTGSAVAGFGIATLTFGALHRYQGWKGMIATTLFGGAMTALYLMSGALWLVMALHALVDLNALVVWPALARSREGRRWLGN